MKVLLIKDVYKLGRAGDVKKVADGYGRNYLLPQGFAVLATSAALKQSEAIRAQADARRVEVNKEMGSVAQKLTSVIVAFPSKAGETGKLYGSITTQMIADAITAKTGVAVDRKMVEVQPIRVLGEHLAHIRLTVDLVPVVKVIVHREGETVVIDEAPAAEEAAE